MKYNGTFMNLSGQLIYRVIPKAACSTVGNLLYFIDNNKFYNGDFHTLKEGFHNWSFPISKEQIQTKITEKETIIFTSVRNPFKRIVSTYYDKIVGIQINNRLYRHKDVAFVKVLESKSISRDQDIDHIKNFRKFVLFARDCVFYDKPFKSDFHWSRQHRMVNSLLRNYVLYDYIVHTETIIPQLKTILSRIKPTYPVDLDTMPKVNTSDDRISFEKPKYEDHFDDMSIALIQEMYEMDFDYFHYDINNPSNFMPLREVDVEEYYYTFLKLVGCPKHLR